MVKNDIQSTLSYFVPWVVIVGIALLLIMGLGSFGFALVIGIVALMAVFMIMNKVPSLEGFNFGLGGRNKESSRDTRSFEERAEERELERQKFELEKEKEKRRREEGPEKHKAREKDRTDKRKEGYDRVEHRERYADDIMKDLDND